jgi:hypothetical protein
LRRPAFRSASAVRFSPSFVSATAFPLAHAHVIPDPGSYALPMANIFQVIWVTPAGEHSHCGCGYPDAKKEESPFIFEVL